MKSYEFTYGPSKDKITFQKNPSLFGVKLHSGTSIEALKGQLGEELKVNLVGMLGGFQILQAIDSQGADKAIDKIGERDALVKTTHVYNTPGEDNNPFVPTGAIYVKFKEGTSTKVCLDLFKKYDLNKGKQRSERTFVAQITDESLNPLKVTTLLQKEDCIEIAEPDLASKP